MGKEERPEGGARRRETRRGAGEPSATTKINETTLRYVSLMSSGKQSTVDRGYNDAGHQGNIMQARKAQPEEEGQREEEEQQGRRDRNDAAAKWSSRK